MKKTVALMDYGMGNLHSAAKALTLLGARVLVTERREEILAATHVILPGVGAFPDAMKRLADTGLAAVAKEAALKKPFLGICLGMQLMLRRSSEGGPHEGLSLFDGDVTLLPAPQGEKIPHMGWNEVVDRLGCPLLRGVSGRDFYFVHSYCALDITAPFAAGVTQYGAPLVSVAWNGLTAFGVQFHPEKSGEAGLKLLANFLEITEV